MYRSQSHAAFGQAAFQGGGGKGGAGGIEPERDKKPHVRDERIRRSYRFGRLAENGRSHDSVKS